MELYNIFTILTLIFLGAFYHFSENKSQKFFHRGLRLIMVIFVVTTLLFIYYTFINKSWNQ